MSLSLGLDTGGTYTDAVLQDSRGRVLAHAKALTTKHDLAIGLREAVSRLIPAASAPGEVDLVGLSTTLATNAIVEGHASPICLLLLGYERDALDRSDLRAAMRDDPVVFIRGGHTAMGDEQEPLDLDTAAEAIHRHASRVSAFAISGFFSVRNPAHERAVADLVARLTDRPSTCGHELTLRLDAPRRALTTALNARLIPQLRQLIRAVETMLSEHGIRAPLMVVKGDGSLMDATVAFERPIETILSGPAASLVGARHLSGLDDVFVVDMGGTTTDIALLEAGRPALRAEGAMVGGWRTMVEAVSVHSFGLGGDSEIRWSEPSLDLAVGPRRLVPLSLLAQRWPETLSVLRAQLDVTPGPWQGRFALRQRALDTDAEGLTGAQAKVWAALANGPVAMAEFAVRYAARRAVEALVDRGLAVFAGLTPSDAAHVLGRQSDWSAEGARIGAVLFCRTLPHQDDGDAESLCERILDRVVEEAGRALLAAALRESASLELSDDAMSRWLSRRAFIGRSAAAEPFEVSLTLRRPLVAVGAPVGTYYPRLAERLHTRLVIPPNAAVANAVGAVSGGIVQTATALITAPSDGLFRVHGPEENKDFAHLPQAEQHAVASARRQAAERAVRAGAADPEVHHVREDRILRQPDGAEVFLEVKVTATAIGRPRLASGHLAERTTTRSG